MFFNSFFYSLISFTDFIMHRNWITKLSNCFEIVLNPIIFSLSGYNYFSFKNSFSLFISTLAVWVISLQCEQHHFLLFITLIFPKLTSRISAHESVKTFNSVHFISSLSYISSIQSEHYIILINLIKYKYMYIMTIIDKLTTQRSAMVNVRFQLTLIINNWKFGCIQTFVNSQVYEIWTKINLKVIEN